MKRIINPHNRIQLYHMLIAAITFAQLSSAQSAQAVSVQRPQMQSDLLCKVVNAIRANKQALYVISGYYALPISSVGTVSSGMAWDAFLQLTGFTDAELRTALAEWIGTGRLDASAQISHSELRFHDIDPNWCPPPPSGQSPTGQLPGLGAIAGPAICIVLAVLLLVFGRRRTPQGSQS